MPGDRVALLSENRPEWPIVDYAVVSLRAVTVAVYPSLPASQVLEILLDCEPCLVIATDERAAMLREAQALEAPPAGNCRVATLSELGLHAPATPADLAGWRERALLAAPADLATFIFGHDRAAQGRDADARQPGGNGGGHGAARLARRAAG
jgi:long-chain acyl-CoA synthetase